MPLYQVVVDCYVPIGSGERFKRVGQVVTLDDSDAAELRGYVELFDTSSLKATTRSRATAQKVSSDKVAEDLNAKLAGGYPGATKPDSDADDE